MITDFFGKKRGRKMKLASKLPKNKSLYEEYRKTKSIKKIRYSGCVLTETGYDWIFGFLDMRSYPRIHESKKISNSELTLYVLIFTYILYQRRLKKFRRHLCFILIPSLTNDDYLYSFMSICVIQYI